MGGYAWVSRWTTLSSENVLVGLGTMARDNAHGATEYSRPLYNSTGELLRYAPTLHKLTGVYSRVYELGYRHYIMPGGVVPSLPTHIRANSVTVTAPDPA
jgi:hypothetical protein